MTQRDHILIVEDDPPIRDLLRDYLEKNGCRASTAADGDAMWPLLERDPPDLLVLDIMLPGEDGLTLCRQLRAAPATARLPVIMLTARGEETDRIVGLEMGADDYLPKPFNPRELLARIKSVLRRARQAPPENGPEPPPLPPRLHFAGWTLDTRREELTAPDGVLVSLTRGELLLLLTFLRHPGEVLDRDRLTADTRGRESTPFDRGIDVQVGRLRKRLGEDSRQPRIIQTVWGRGYRLGVPVTPGE